MSRRFGSIRQVAFVVRNLEQALEYWTGTLGVGPFFVLRNMTPQNYRYLGKPSPAPLLTIALANSGDLQVELIEQHDDKPSAYRDFLSSGREGFQHVSSWVTRPEYDEIMAAAERDGMRTIHEGVVPGSEVRFAYFATESAPGGLVYEISEAMEPHIYPFMQMIAEAARTWDGSEPVREISL
jgi:catechol 2,3-dioxygenase-like lactoylglutathione lyase family enzyme